MDTLTHLTAVGETAHRAQLEAALRNDRLAAPGPVHIEYEEEPDETLVVDHREALRPAQHVESKLVAMLHMSPVMMSQLQKDSRPRAR